jgi:hypothetical protein
MLLVLLVCLIPASSSAGVFISVAIAPPALPVYEQPPCPEPGWMWTPGYWAYGPDGYYWVPGTWVPAPYVGALWTPGYWGWSSGLYLWHPGYWGRHVGYYGGVNYGFGFFGIGFAGGAWRGGVFAYNRAVVHVNETVIHNTYIDNTYVHNTIVNDRRVAFSGGPGGINHPPAPEERMAERDQHMEPTAFQEQHRTAAMQDRGAYFNNNHGRPNNTAMERPMSGGPHANPGSFNNNSSRPGPGNFGAQGRGGQNPQFQGGHGNQMPHPNNEGNPGGQPHLNNGGNQGGQARPQMYEQHNSPQPQNHGQHNNPQPQIHEPHNNPQPQNQPHNNPQPHPDHGGQGNQGHDHGKER